MHNTDENTVISYAWVHLVLFKFTTRENTVISYVWVYLVGFYGYYWWKQGK